MRLITEAAQNKYISNKHPRRKTHRREKKNKGNQAAIGMNNIIMIRLKDD
jgi:hypothetical protein